MGNVVMAGCFSFTGGDEEGCSAALSAGVAFVEAEWGKVRGARFILCTGMWMVQEEACLGAAAVCSCSGIGNFDHEL